MGKHEHQVQRPRTAAAITIGVAGGSGSGKTTFSCKLQAALGEDYCGILSQDAYYRDRHEFFDRDGGQLNFDHPDALEFDLLVEHLKLLKAGQDIAVPIYDFVTHRRLSQSQSFLCRSVIIVDGVLLLSQSEVRPLLDLAIFVDTSESLRFARRLKRDVHERGRTPEGVREQFMRHVKPMHDLFVEPTRRFADRVVSGEKPFTTVIHEIATVLKGGPP